MGSMCEVVKGGGAVQSFVEVSLMNTTAGLLDEALQQNKHRETRTPRPILTTTI